jgi:hypothetical protein
LIQQLRLWGNLRDRSISRTLGLRAGAGVSGVLSDISQIKAWFATMGSPHCDSL